MNTEGDLTPPQPEPVPGDPTQPTSTPGPAPDPTQAGALVPSAPSPSWFSRYRLPVISAAGAVAMGAIAVGAVLLLAKPNPTIEKMVPASQDVLVVANLNPSLGQKVNLLRAVHKFPDTSTDAAISKKLDEAFKDTGLSYTNDVQPWLDGEVGVSAKIDLQNGADSPFAFFATSRDDSKAKAALTKLRTGSTGKKYSWRDDTYNGFSIASGTPKVTSEKPVAYGYVDHVVVIASSAAVIHDIIDTDQGRSARLVDSADFKATMALLPSDRLGMGYVAGKSLVAKVKKQLAAPSTLGLPALKWVDDLNALQGIGGSVSATTTGVAFDLGVKVDASKLSAASRQAMAATGQPDAVLRWIPRSSNGFFAVANIDKSIKTALDQYGTDPSVKASTDAVGLTGPGGILPHLTGDLGLEVEVGNVSNASGAILIGTDNTAAMNAFFGKLLAMARQFSSGYAPGASQGGPGSTFGSFTTASFETVATVPTVPSDKITTTRYRGVVITSWSSPSLSGFVPSYAAVDRMGILGSSLAEVKAVIDAHINGANITTDATYQAASASSLTHPAGILYVNVTSLLSTVQKLASGSSVDTKAMANLSPVRAFMLTGTSQSGSAVERFFVAIQ